MHRVFAGATALASGPFYPRCAARGNCGPDAHVSFDVRIVWKSQESFIGGELDFREPGSVSRKGFLDAAPRSLILTLGVERCYKSRGASRGPREPTNVDVAQQFSHSG